MGMYDHATLGSWLQKCSYQRFSDKTFLHVIAELPANDLPGIQRGGGPLCLRSRPHLGDLASVDQATGFYKLIFHDRCQSFLE